MAKEIKFNIKLLVDGKEQLVTASTSVAELKKGLDSSNDSATRFKESLSTLAGSTGIIRGNIKQTIQRPS